MDPILSIRAVGTASNDNLQKIIGLSENLRDSPCYFLKNYFQMAIVSVTIDLDGRLTPFFFRISPNGSYSIHSGRRNGVKRQSAKNNRAIGKSTR